MLQIDKKKSTHADFYIQHIFKNKKWSREGIKKAAIVFIFKGDIAVSMDDFNYQTIEAGKMFIVPPECLLYLKALKDSYLIISLFDAMEPLGSFIIPSDAKPEVSEFMHLPISSIIQDYLSLVEIYIKGQINEPNFMELKRRELFRIFYLTYPQEELTAFFAPIIDKNVQFKILVTNHFLQAKSTEELATLTHYSTSGFIKKFRRCFGESPHKWINNQKAQRILLDLEKGEKLLKQIAFEYHFSSYKRFSNFCKTQYGDTPAKLRMKKKA